MAKLEGIDSYKQLNKSEINITFRDPLILNDVKRVITLRCNEALEIEDYEVAHTYLWALERINEVLAELEKEEEYESDDEDIDEYEMIYGKGEE